MTDEMKIKAIAPWFGGKRTLAPAIVAELGPHSAYWEPFCGSMAVLLAKEQSSFETVNDQYGEVINLAWVLQREELAIELYATVSRLLLHEEIFHEAAARYRERGHSPAGEPDVSRAADFMICSWFGRNGVSGTSSYNQGFCVRYTKNGGHAATRWCSAVESIPAWHQRLRSVTILNRDGFEVLERIEDAPGVVVYCDPPYVEKRCKYIHDFERADHARLAELLFRFKRTRVVVSYYDHPELDELYRQQPWFKRKLKATKALVNQGMRDGKGAVEAPEVLWMNMEPLAADPAMKGLF